MEYLVPASAALLEGYQGPAVHAEKGHRVGVVIIDRVGYGPHGYNVAPVHRDDQLWVDVSSDRLSLDLSIPSVRDHCVRRLAESVGWEESHERRGFGGLQWRVLATPGCVDVCDYFADWSHRFPAVIPKGDPGDRVDPFAILAAVIRERFPVEES